jgi:HTH-type transcriptional regulator, sugar sensing transcriptional regulator
VWSCIDNTGKVGSCETSSQVTQSTSACQHLVDLGFNDVDRGVPCASRIQADRCLRHRPPDRKATANTYKAVESLARRGAVLVEDGDHRVCRAVSVREFIAHSQQSFVERTRAAEQSLSRLPVETNDERVYKLK